MDAKEAGQAMKRFRQRRGLTQDQVVEQSTVPTPQYLSALENGRHDIRNSDHFPSLAQVLGLSTEEIRELKPDLIWEDRSPRRGPPIPPVVPFRDTQITIPAELLEMVEKHGKDYPILKTDQMQRMLAAPRNFGGAEVGPQTAEDWFDYWMANKRFLT